MISLSHFVVLYGGVVTNNNNLNPDTIGRCEAALKVARRSENSFIIFSVGYSIPRLTETTIAYLKESGWPQEKLILNPKGYNSLTETEAAIEVLDKHQTKEVVVATSWYHVPRIWLIWQLKYKSNVKFSVAWQTARPIWSILYEFLAIPKNILVMLFQWFKYQQAQT